MRYPKLRKKSTYPHTVIFCERLVTKTIKLWVKHFLFISSSHATCEYKTGQSRSDCQTDLGLSNRAGPRVAGKLPFSVFRPSERPSSPTVDEAGLT